MEENKGKPIEMSIATYVRLIELETRINVLLTFLEGSERTYIDIADVQKILGLQVTSTEKGEDE